MTDPSARGSRALAPGVIGLGVATAVSGGLGWLTLAVVGRVSGPAGYATFALLWAVFYGFGGSLAGLQQEVTRAVQASSAQAAGRRLAPALAIGVVVALVAIGSSPWWGRAHSDLGSTLVLAIGLLGLTALVSVNGLLTVERRWTALGLLLVGDAVVRLVAVSLVEWLDGGEVWSALAIVSGAFVWLPFVLAPGRALTLRVVAGGTRPFMARALVAMVSTASAALLVGGYPLLLAATSTVPLDARDGVLLAALVLIRTPPLMILYGYRPVILKSMLAGGATNRVVWNAWTLFVVAGGVGALVAATVGPRLVALVYGDDFVVSAGACGAMVVGALLLMMMTVSGLALLATDRHRSSTAGWLAAVAATCLVLMLSQDDHGRFLAGIIVGPLVGVFWHAGSLLAFRRALEPGAPR